MKETEMSIGNAVSTRKHPHYIEGLQIPCPPLEMDDWAIGGFDETVPMSNEIRIHDKVFDIDL